MESIKDATIYRMTSYSKDLVANETTVDFDEEYVLLTGRIVEIPELGSTYNLWVESNEVVKQFWKCKFLGQVGSVYRFYMVK